MKSVALFYLLFISSFMFSQRVKDSSYISHSKHIFELSVDTLKLQNIDAKPPHKSWHESPAMPWIIALVVCIITVIVNIYITQINKKTAIKNVQSQLRLMNETSKSQIESAKEIALKQINNSKELSIIQFKATLNTKNRQEWIDDVRHIISECLSQCAMIQLEMASKDEPTIKAEKIQPYFEKLIYNQNKLKMLLNHNKEEQKEVIDKLEDVVKLCSKKPDAFEFRDYQDLVIIASRKLFEKHWNKIKEL